MGGGLSTPRSTDLTTGTSRPPRSRLTVNARTLTAPLAAMTMACILFIYSRTSIQAAKLNARKHREADGGTLSWHRESLRQHGQLERVEERGVSREALSHGGGSAAPTAKAEKGAGKERERAMVGGADRGRRDEKVEVRERLSREEEDLRKIMGKGGSVGARIASEDG